MGRIAAFVGVVLVLVVAAFLGAGSTIRSSVRATFAIAQTVRDARTLAFGSLRAQLDEETGIRGYAATGSGVFLQPYFRGHRELPALMEQLGEKLRELSIAEAYGPIADAQFVAQRWDTNVANPILRNHGRSTVETELEGKDLVDRFRADMTAVDAALSARNELLKRDFNAEIEAFSALVVVTGLTLLLVGAIFIVLQTRLARREIAVRAAYRAEKRVSETLQQGFSLRALPALPKMTFSATYVPAAEEAHVGGDWYDALEIGDDRVLFVIGDVAGHGVDAAVAMSRVRNEMLVAAVANPDPAAILQRVNERMFETAERLPVLTAIVGVANAATYAFEYAGAGHPPPILAGPDREPEALAFGGIGLGIKRGAQYVTRHVQSSPGGMLILYTDGMIEHSRNVVEGERQLLEAVAGLAPGSDPAAAVYREIFGGRAAADDVAILAIGFRAGPGAGRGRGVQLRRKAS